MVKRNKKTFLIKTFKSSGMLTTTYTKLFSQAVDTFCVNIIMKRGVSAYDEKFTLFYPLIGKDFHINRDLLIYGQATNG